MNFLVIDIGTSKCRAAVVSSRGEIISQSSLPVQIKVEQPSFTEVDIDPVWHQLQKVIRLEREKNPDIRLDAVGVSAMLGYVFLDRKNQPLMPAIIWMDNRAKEESEEILEVFGKEEFYRRTGRRVSPELLAPKILWLRRHRPDVAKALRSIIGLKDEMVRRLTGVIQSDYAHLNYTLCYNIAQRELDAELLEAFKISSWLFPEPVPAAEVVGSIKRQTAARTGLKEGTPVVSGSSDGTAAMYGGGVLEQGRAVLVSGTTDVLMMGTSSIPDDASMTLSINNAMVPDLYLAGGSMGLSGGALAHIENLLNVSAQDREDRIARLPPGSGGLLFLPGLTGERSPYWKDRIRGAMFGLTLKHAPAHLFRALMEGSCYRIHRLLRAMGAAGLNPTTIHAVGGCAKMDVWNQMRADVTGLKISKLAGTEATLLGTAQFCRAALDPTKSLGDISREWIKVEKDYLPDPQALRFYRRYAALFDGAVEAAESICKELHELEKEII